MPPSPQTIAINALREIVDIEKSSNVGWNGLNNAVSVARRALARIENQEQLEIDKSIERDINHQKHGI